MANTNFKKDFLKILRGHGAFRIGTAMWKANYTETTSATMSDFIPRQMPNGINGHFPLVHDGSKTGSIQSRAISLPCFDMESIMHYLRTRTCAHLMDRDSGFHPSLKNL